MATTVKPIGPRVVAQKEEVKAKTASGIILPEAAKEKPKTAKVISVGVGVKGIKKGDSIIYKEYAATEVTIDKQEFIIVNEEDVLATVN